MNFWFLVPIVSHVSLSIVFYVLLESGILRQEW